MPTNYFKVILSEIEEVLDSIGRGSEEEHALLNAIKQKDVRVLGYGAGRMGFGLKAFMMRLNHLGINASFFGDNYVPPLRDGDVLIVCSNSGETKSVLNIENIVRAKVPGAKIFVVTGNSNSSMAKIGDHVITFKTCNGGLNSKDDPSKINSVQPMTTLTEQAMFIYFDYLVLRYLQENDIDLESTKAFHSNIE